MDLSGRLAALKTGFSRSFWVANVLELFERCAFYSSKAILAVYLVERVGLGPLGQSLVGLYGFAVFFLPILAGPFVDRYGFRRSLAACFAIFSLGYSAVGLAALPAGAPLVALVGTKAYVVGALLLTAVGGSLIKPCVVGTVARTTTTETKSLGYSIYYTLVNIGAALGPLLAVQVREAKGIEYVLVTSAATSALLFAGTLLFFREPERLVETEKRSLGRVLAEMVLVFRNARFIGFLVVFSGFWVMFWQMFDTLPFYVRDVLKVSQFELVGAVEPWSIILLTVPVTALMKNVKPLPAMTAGFAVASVSWLLLAFWATWESAAAAMFLLALGEVLQAPRFYEYVADLAPGDQVGTFMGFAFLPVAIGALVAGPLSAWLVQHFLRELGRPAGIWFVLSGIGFGATALMLLYDRFIVKGGGAPGH